MRCVKPTILVAAALFLAAAPVAASRRTIAASVRFFTFSLENIRVM